jgi:hypothetical protein
MKHFFFSKGLILLTLLMFTFGCINEESFKHPDSSEITIDEAKHWFESNIKSLENTDGITARIKKSPRDPHWDFAVVTQFKNSSVVSVPLKHKECKRYNKGTQSRLVISKDERGKVNLQILKAIGNSSYNLQVDYKIGLDDFSGIVKIEDWDGNFVGGEYYVNGKPIAKLENADFNKTKSSTGRVAGYKWVLVTVDWWQETFIDGESGGRIYLGTTHYYKLVYEEDSYEDLYGTFYSWSGGGGSGGGGSSGCPYSPSCSDPIPFDSGEVIVDIEEIYPSEIQPDPLRNELCGTLNFTTVGSSHTTQINGLGLFAKRSNGEAFNVELGSNCTSIPNYNLNSIEASEVFKEAFRLSIQSILIMLNDGSIAPNSSTVRPELINLIRSNLNSLAPGSSFSSGPCSGNILENQALYKGVNC